MLKKEYLIYKLSEAAREACKIDNELFPMYNVKRGLRNEDGSGVLVGLTQVGNTNACQRAVLKRSPVSYSIEVTT